MKKITLLSFVALFCAMAFSSCQDKTNDFVHTFFTDKEIGNALTSCLNVSKDTAISHLCVEDGLAANPLYRLDFPSELSELKDKLSEENKADLIDSLVLKMNRAAESLGNDYTTLWAAKIKALTYTSPGSILKGGNTAATDYFRQQSEAALITEMTSMLQTKMSANGGSDYWQQILNYSATPISFDLYHDMAAKNADALFLEMQKEEAKIRTLESHRVTTILETVFAE